MTFTVGSRVTWKSQAAGVWREKTGTVFAIVHWYETAWDALGNAGVAARPGGWSRRRPTETSYIVREDNGRLYWPRVSALVEVPGPLRPCGCEESRHLRAGLERIRDTVDGRCYSDADVVDVALAALKLEPLP